MDMSLFAKGLYFAYGCSNFTQAAYRRGERFFTDDLNGYDLKGKKVLVTGGSRGIGFAACLYFARMGAELHYVCRSEDTGMDSIEEMKGVSGNESVYYHVVDLADLKQMKAFAEKWVRENEKVDVLVHNAGNLFNERYVDERGLDLHFVLNALSNFYLTMSFLELLKKSEDPRVIFVSSGAMLTEKLYIGTDFNQRFIYSPLIAYARSKKIQVALCERFSELYTDIKFFSMHPGWVETEAMMQNLPFFYKTLKGNLRTIEEGADTICWLAVTNQISNMDNGKFYRDRREEIKNFYFAKTEYTSYDVDLLWNWCKEACQWDKSDKTNFNTYQALLQKKLPTATVAVGFKSVKNCFTGRDAVEFVKRELELSGEDAVTKVQSLVEDQYIRFADRRYKVFSPNEYFKLNKIPKVDEVRKHIGDSWISNIMKYIDIKGEARDWVKNALKSDKDTTIYTRACPDHKVLSVKLVSSLECKKKQLDDIIINRYLERQHEWSPSFDFGYVVDEIDKDIQIQYWKYNIGWFVSPRDFLVVRRKLEYEGGTLVVDRSIKYGKQQDIPGVVRSHLYFQVRYYKDLGNGRFTFISCNETDSKGWIPKKIVDWSATSITSTEEHNLMQCAKRKRTQF